jgi:hypothetical protein
VTSSDPLPRSCARTRTWRGSRHAVRWSPQWADGVDRIACGPLSELGARGVKWRGRGEGGWLWVKSGRKPQGRHSFMGGRRQRKARVLMSVMKSLLLGARLKLALSLCSSTVHSMHPCQLDTVYKSEGF